MEYNNYGLDLKDGLSKAEVLVRNSNIKVTVSGRIYNLFVSRDIEPYAVFRLNFKEDRYIEVFVSKKKYAQLRNYNINLEEKSLVKITGYLKMYSVDTCDEAVTPKMQINCTFLDVQEQAAAAVFRENMNPKKLPDTVSKIAVLSSYSSAGKKDFINKINKRYNNNLTIVEKNVPMEGSAAIQAISDAIKEINDRHEAELICIVRGGGDAMAIDYVFNDADVCRAIESSKIPVLTAIGHAVNKTCADMVSDAPVLKDGTKKCFITPTDLAGFLNYRYNQPQTRQHDASGGLLLKVLIAVIIILLAYILLKG